MHLSIRSMQAGDLANAGRVLSRAFNAVFEAHGYAPPFRSERSAQDIADWYFQAEPEDCLVAEIRGHLAGIAFLHRRGPRASIGPVAVDPRYQRLHLGRMLMARLLEQSAGYPSVRLFQDAFNADSFALYSKLGFRAVETVPIVLAKAGPGKQVPAAEPPAWAPPPGMEILQVHPAEAERMAEIDRQLTGAERLRDLRYLLEVGLGLVLRQEGRDIGYLCAYSSHGGTYVGPGLAPGEEQMFELLAEVRRFYPQQGMIFRLPARNAALLARLLGQGFRVSSLGTLMARGEYQVPEAAELLAVFPESL